MSPEDPIQYLQAHYGRLREVPMPPIQVHAPFRWFEVVGGLAAGAAAVLIVVSVCLSGQSAQPTGGALIEHQMRGAGLTLAELQPEIQAEMGGQWQL